MSVEEKLADFERRYAEADAPRRGDIRKCVRLFCAKNGVAVPQYAALRQQRGFSLNRAKPKKRYIPSADEKQARALTELEAFLAPIERAAADRIRWRIANRSRPPEMATRRRTEAPAERLR